MKIRSVYILLIVLAFAYSLRGSERKAIDDIVVTGEVKNIKQCPRPDKDIWSYQIHIQLHAKNVGPGKSIISTADGIIDFYKLAPDLDTLATKWNIHVGWVTSGPPPDPIEVPKEPVPPFKVVGPGENADIEIDLAAFIMEELKPGTQYVQIVAENWPEYSDKYTARIRDAWKSHGILWEHSLHSEPIQFIVPSKLQETRCQ